MKKLKQRANLNRQAVKLGIAAEDMPLHIEEPELQRRVMEVDRHGREASFWLFAVVTALGISDRARPCLVRVFHPPDLAQLRIIFVGCNTLIHTSDKKRDNRQYDVNCSPSRSSFW